MSNESTKLLGPPIGYTDLLDAHTMDKLEAEDNSDRKYTPLRPSAAGKCGRELAYEFMEYRGKAKYPKGTKTPSEYRLLNLGHSVEWNLLRQFEEVELFKVKYKQQVVSFFKISPEEWIEGSVDAVMYSPKWKAVIDVKSKKDKFSRFGETKWDEDSIRFANMNTVVKVTDSLFYVDNLKDFLTELNDAFFASNFYQLNMYANSQFLLERGVDHAAVIQYNKNDSRLREFRFKPSKEVYEQTETKFKGVAEAVDVHSDPERVPKDHVLGSIKCAFCPYSKKCWGEDTNSRQEFFKKFPKKNWPDQTDRLGAVGDELEFLYDDFKSAEGLAEAAGLVEAEIIKIMDRENINKIKFSDGAIYELKALKSPYPHLALRRGKV
jgi:hypothetical protein